MKMGLAVALSVDLPWSTQSRGRTVIAGIDAAGSVGLVDLGCGLKTDRLLVALTELAGPAPLVLLDIPVEGCAGLRPGDYRRLELRLKRLQMGVLPAGDAGMLGPELAAQIRAALPGARVLEGHPYGTLKVLNALAGAGLEPIALAGPLHTVLDQNFPGCWPPRYKRARTVTERSAACEQVKRMLLRFFPESTAALSGPAGGTTDALDALLGLYPAWLAQVGSPWAYLAADRSGGSILLVADAWWRARFESLQPVRELAECDHGGVETC